MILTGEGYEVICAERGEDATTLSVQNRPDAVLLDIVLPDIDGIEVLKRIKARSPDLPVIMISGHGTVQDAVQATRLGAYDFFEKPLSKEKILLTLGHALETRTLRRGFEMIGEGPSMLTIREQVSRVGAHERPSAAPGRERNR